jgi:hypothetical protein
MAVVGWRETVKGSGVSGRYGESNTYKRAFLVRVDHPATSKVAICRAPGVVYGSPHPDQPDCKAMEFDCSMSDDVGLWWTVSVAYYVPEPTQIPDAQGIPVDAWAASGGTSTGPAFEDIDGETITNTAGDPLEGLEQENDDISWTLTTCFEDLSWNALRLAASNTVNDSTWNGGAAGTWKVNFRGATKKTISTTESGTAGQAPTDGSNAPDNGTEGTVTYWETTWEFRYRKNGWALKPWNVGFNELISGERQAIVGGDGKAVKQPVALTSSGTAKTPGQKPDALEFLVYDEADFSDAFGEPS